ncbi:leucyl aminopeptidase [Stieleria varia]|uniref:leucyl aminopeptidase n=1 Tax=Stieleria varia TaxID=2528005 RepID=UPI00313A8922
MNPDSHSTPVSRPFAQPQLHLIDNPHEADADVLVTGIYLDQPLSPTLAVIDKVSDGSVGRLVKQGKVSAKRGDTFLIPGPGTKSDGGGPHLVMILGLGDRLTNESSTISNRSLAFDSAATALRGLPKGSVSGVNVALAECFEEDVHDMIVAGAISALEGQAIYQTGSDATSPEAIGFSGLVESALQQGQSLGQSINHTKRLVNEPPSILFPESFAERARVIADEVGLGIEVWDEKRLEAEGCRAILAVGAGSSRPPRLVILKHNGGGDEPPVAIVGKGVTFDSGGLSIKPSEGMLTMKMDMAGAATVVGVMHALAKLDVKRNVIGVCGLAENMISGSSYKLGDVIETRSGKTIEIHNTDAEGRVVLADTLDVAIGHLPVAMLDLATLTGACMVALGKEVAGLMTNDQSLCDAVSNAARIEGEPVWQLPMFELYDDKIKSKVADIKNVGEARWGGAITAAKFLQQFVGDVPWVHTDIAGPAFADSPLPARDAGATGVMVRTLIRWIQSMS